jgi:hypothetical protein
MILQLFILFSFILAEPNLEKSIESIGPDHISLIIHQDLINDFFTNLGKIKGSSNAFDWNLKNPRINITSDKAVFNAEIQIYNNILSVTKDVIGKVDISYNKNDNLIIIKIVDADVIIDIAGYDVGKIDIGKYFSKPLKLNGPQAVSNHIEFVMPSGKSKIIDVIVNSHSLKLIDGGIKLSTSLGFESIIE